MSFKFLENPYIMSLLGAGTGLGILHLSEDKPDLPMSLLALGIGGGIGYGASKMMTPDKVLKIDDSNLIDHSKTVKSDNSEVIQLSDEIEESMPLPLKETIIPKTTSNSLTDYPISGREIPMNYSLLGWNEKEPNPLADKGVTTTFEAMRGHGRVHTSRNYPIQSYYRIKEGDYATVYDKNSGRRMVVKVGKEHPITPEMINDPEYLSKWSEEEKHHPSLLQQQKYKYGMYFTPVGDLIDGKVIPYETLSLDESMPKKVMISGSRSIRSLPEQVIQSLDKIIDQNLDVVIGDAYGVDSEVQKYLASKKYTNVTVYHLGDKPRNNFGFPTISVPANRYVDRDKVMQELADYGLAIWDGKSPGTKANIAAVPKTKVIQPTTK